MHMRRGQTHNLAGGRAEAAESLAHPVTAMLLSVNCHHTSTFWRQLPNIFASVLTSQAVSIKEVWRGLIAS